MLVEAGGDVNARRDTGATPLFLAAQQNVAPELVKLLVRSGAIIDAQTNVSIFVV